MTIDSAGASAQYSFLVSRLPAALAVTIVEGIVMHSGFALGVLTVFCLGYVEAWTLVNRRTGGRVLLWFGNGCSGEPGH